MCENLNPGVSVFNPALFPLYHSGSQMITWIAVTVHISSSFQRVSKAWGHCLGGPLSFKDLRWCSIQTSGSTVVYVNQAFLVLSTVRSSNGNVYKPKREWSVSPTIEKPCSIYSFIFPPQSGPLSP